MPDLVRRTDRNMGVFDGIKEMAQNAGFQSAPPVPPGWDPTKFNDPVAIQTDWDPAYRGGASFRTRKLVPKGPMRMEFRASAGYVAFGLVFAAIGLLAFFLGLLGSGEGNAWVAMLVGGAFALVGVGLVVGGRRPVVFDKSNGWFWKAWREPQGVAPSGGQKAVRLSDIHALQIVRERIQGKNSSYWSYELNIVLHDASRANVIDHGKLKDVQSDGATLAGFLGVPLWDATTQLVAGKSVLF